MKENTVMLILIVILLVLLGNILLFDNKNVTKSPNKLSFESYDELAVFVTLENEVKRNSLGSHGKEEIEDISASITVNFNQGNTEGDISREPDYVYLYPNLYAEPSEEEEHVSTQEVQKVCFLTFDDGPSEQTWKVLDILDEKGIKATFFVIGKYLTDKDLECLKEIASRGHTIGLHTFQHNYAKLYRSVNSFLDDYNQIYTLIEETTGVRPSIYRFPGGSYNSYLKKIRKELITEMDRRGFTFYDWNVSGEDAVGTPTKSSIKKNVLRDVVKFRKPVILLHDGTTNELTTTVLSDIIDDIAAEGYEFSTLEYLEH